MSNKTASGLVAYCKAQLGRPYWMGTYGQTATAALYLANKKRLPQYYTATDFPSQYGQRVHDCVGLIKGYRWSETPTSAPRYTASQDVAVSGLLGQCGETGSIATMPDLPGVCVFMDGHVGIYIGAGEVIEARGHAYGVVQTRLAARPWRKWGKPSWLTYDTAPGTSSDANTTKEEKTVQVTLNVLQYGSSGAQVKTVQRILYARGIRGADGKTMKVDGSYGKNTAAGVKTLQKQLGLSQTGVVDAQTWTAALTKLS